MYSDVLSFCVLILQWSLDLDSSTDPSLQPIPIQRPFQKIGVDVMDLPCIERGNKHVVVFQDMFCKWQSVFPVPDQWLNTSQRCSVKRLFLCWVFQKPYSPIVVPTFYLI